MEDDIYEKILFGIKVANENVLVLYEKMEEILARLTPSPDETSFGK